VSAVPVKNSFRSQPAFSAIPASVIQMDIQMPYMNGFEATKAIREKGITTPIIAVTANAMKGDDQKCLKAGCNEYLAKPIDRRELLKTIDY